MYGTEGRNILVPYVDMFWMEAVEQKGQINLFVWKSQGRIQIPNPKKMTVWKSKLACWKSTRK